MVTGADAVALDVVTGAWLIDRERAAGDLAGARAGNNGSETPLVPIRVDGKTVRGVRGVVAAQTEVGAKTNEIPMIIPLLDGLSLDGAVVTADALHTQRATADHVHGTALTSRSRSRTTSPAF